MDAYGAAAIGKRVRAYRRAANMTADQLAAKVDGLTGNAVAKLENGHRREVSTELLVQLAWALQVPPLVLLLPIENDRALIKVGGIEGTSESLGAWVMGLPILDSDAGGASRLGNAVHAQYRHLVITALGLQNDITTQVMERGKITPAEHAQLAQSVEEGSQTIHTSRSMLRILRNTLGLDDG